MGIMTGWNSPKSIYKEYLNHPLGLTLLTPSLVIIIIIINRNADDDQFDEIVDRLLRHDKARVSVKT